MKFRRLFVAAGTAVALVSFGAVPAYAAPTSEPVVDLSVIEQALADVGALRAGAARGYSEGNASPDAAPGILTDAGLTLTANGMTLTMTPAANGEVTWTDGGVPVYGHTDSSVFALTNSSQGENAGYSVLLSPDAPTEYSYEFSVDGAPASLVLVEGGAVQVLDSKGNVANIIAPAWAKGADGSAVSTEYVVSGNVLTQMVSPSESTVFPVVADPRLRCDGLWCTTELSRSDTAKLADNALNAGLACGVMGPGVVPCTVLVAGAWAMANIARNTGQCVGVRVWQSNMISNMHMAYIPCYA